MNRRAFLAFLAALSLRAGAAAFAAETRHDVPVGDSQALGHPNAPVTLVEFVDYQ